jgi:hypothetical protein
MKITKYFTEAQLTFLKMVVELHDDNNSSYINIRSVWTRKMLGLKTYSDSDAANLNQIGYGYKKWYNRNGKNEYSR